MANTLRFKRGLLAGLPSAAVGEPLFTTDTFDLYIGTASGTQKYQKFIASGTTSQLLRGDGSLLTMPIVLTSPSNGQVLKFNGTNWVNDSDAGITGSGANGRLAYWNGTNTQTSSAALTFNGTNTLTIDGGTTGYIIGPSGEMLIGEDAGGIYIGIGFGVAPSIPINYGSIGTTTHIWRANTAERMRLNSAGNLLLGSSTDNGLRFQVTGDGYFSGGVRMLRALTINGASIPTDRMLEVTGTTFVTGATNYGIVNNPTYATPTTIYGYYSGIVTTSATNAYGVFLEGPTGTITNYYSLYSNVNSGTGRWNLYMNGTAANYLAGNLGIGTTTINVSLLGRAITISSANSGLELTSATNVVQGTVQSNSNGLTLEGIGTAGMRFFTSASGATSERMRLDASGNLGLGVTPSAWGSTYRALQVGVGTSLYNLSTSNGTFLGSNYFFNGTNNIYINTATATAYGQVSGQHQWFNAPSGTAGTAVSFTQAMTLDASGRLGIGVTSPTQKLHVAGTGISRIAIENTDNQSTGAGLFMFVKNGASVVGSGTIRVDNVGDMTFWNGTSSDSQKMLLDVSGRLSIGSGSVTSELLQVNGTMRVSGASTFGGIMQIGSGVIYSGMPAFAQFIVGSRTTTDAGIVIQSTSTSISRLLLLNASDNGSIVRQDHSTGEFEIFNNGSRRFSIASTGAATFSSSVTFGGNLTVDTATPTLTITSTTTTGTTIGNKGNRILLLSNSATVNNGGEIVWGAENTDTERWAAISGAIKTNSVNGSTGDIIFATKTNQTDTALTPRLTIAADGASTFSSTVSATSYRSAGVELMTSDGTSNYIKTGATLFFQSGATTLMSLTTGGNLTVDTNTLFVDAANNRVGIGTTTPSYALHVTGDGYFGDNLRFPNLKGCVFVQTGGSLLGSIAMDSANAVTIDNNGFAGLSVGGSYTMTGGNLGIGHSAFGTSATKTISVNSGTAPSTSPADAFQLYSADITAGNAAPHFRTENGGIIKLYQQTTGVTSATYIGGAGTTVTDLDTFDGYTIPQIVKALRNAGLLA